MKIFKTAQIKQLDQLTIEHEPISSVDLMERAAAVLYGWFAQNVCNHKKIVVFCGTGNNGGDGLALARMLYVCGYWVEVYYVDSKNTSPDFDINLKRLQGVGVLPRKILDSSQFPTLCSSSIAVDALFGSGLSRAAKGVYADLIDHINASGAKVVAIDIPSGLFGEDNASPNSNAVVRADICLTLEQPKLSFMFAENEQFVKKLVVLPIGISERAKAEAPSNFCMAEVGAVAKMLHCRGTFAHKGTFGHVLVIAGSYGMLGAAQLCVKSALRSGVGLTTVHIPQCGFQIFQQNVPEAIVSADLDSACFTAIDDLAKYTSICIGPGLGTSAKTAGALKQLLQKCTIPLLIDADALNIIANDPSIWQFVPENSVITPHLKEFERLFGPCENGYNRLKMAIEKAHEHKIVIVLKGAYTQVVGSDGLVSFNTTGNPGMATGGSGDVLSGLIGGLLAQGYAPFSAAVVGTYIHGLSGDLAAEKLGEDALKSSDIANFVPNSFLVLAGKLPQSPF